MSRRGRRLRLPVLASAVLVALGALTACSGSGSLNAQGAAPTTTAPNPAGTTAGTTPAATSPTHATGGSAGCGATPVVAPGTTDEVLHSGDADRRYQLIVPQGYTGTKPTAVVLFLHSLTVDYHIVPAMSGAADMAKTYDFIGVSPSGLLSGGRSPYWNAAPAAENYDLTYIGDLLDHLEATLCVDQAQVFSVGMSNGAQMSSLLACRMADRIAGIAPIAGVEFDEPCPGAPVPVIAFHGAQDPIVPYAGGGLNSVTIANQNFYKGDLPPGIFTPTGVDESMRRWAEHNRCGPDFTEARVSPEVRKRTWTGCAATTELYIVDNGGHAWPGKPQPSFEQSFGHGTTDIDATALMFALFFDHKA